MEKNYDHIEGPLQNKVSDETDIMYTYEMQLHPSKVKSLVIDDENLSFFLSISQEKQHILIDHTTFYVKDIRDQKNTHFNTIVFNLNELPLVTTELSRVVMERYFEQKLLSYAFIQYIGKSLGFHQRCPFVSGHEIFIPEKGSTNDSTSWYAAHHILEGVLVKKTNQTVALVRNHYELLLNISIKSFNEQIERATILSYFQQIIISRLVSCYDDTAAYRHDNVLNIVEVRLKRQSFIQMSCPLKKLYHFVQNYRISETLEKIFGEKNPYIEEAREDLLKGYIKDKPSK
ncbi:ComK protein [Desemzia incerta]|uniref:ComK protein n=1 Tax=Desemzia incerta TaxID=82801 RepID=A0A1I5X539_9LACT|nr:competence protein ComK [Desemzia incerta]SFQ27058.1 ComK protein [Desemzia incerta]